MQDQEIYKNKNEFNYRCIMQFCRQRIFTLRIFQNQTIIYQTIIQRSKFCRILTAIVKK